MARELLLLRHGKAARCIDGDDFRRPLKDRGKRAAQRLGVWLWQRDLRPDTVICSPAERARTTAHKCCKSMNVPVSGVIEDARIYDALLGDLLTVLSDAPDAVGRLMLVGHNPGLEALLSHLAGQHHPLATATLAHLRMPTGSQSYVAGVAALERVIRPEDLPEGFPYPAPSGSERRKRPAYYYTQSAVIPYRLTGDGRPEVLLVGSSKGSHWVVPKGIKEPELGPRQSAAREAWEEAGIRGDVGKRPFGRYRVDKWGAQCTVDVYPMRVTEVVDEARWEERHRQRRWLAPEEAAARVKQPELGAMLLDFARQLTR